MAVLSQYACTYYTINHPLMPWCQAFRGCSADPIYCTQFRKEDWHHRLGGGIHADAIMDRIVHRAVWFETGEMNMREFSAKELS